MQKVVVVVSSAVSLQEELIQAYGIRLVPEKIIIENKVYRDRIDITPHEFYPILEKSERIPTTSAPSAQDFVDAFTETAEVADAIVCITVTKGFSQMEFQSALAASKNFSKIPTVVIDSRAAPGAYGFIALAAAKAAAAGRDID
jgi:DegV family protein with EDD domain